VKTDNAAVRDGVAGYAERLHAVAGDGHHVVSPLGAWLLLALCGTGTGKAGLDGLTEVLGCDAGSHYRKVVLEQGGSKPGRQMVRDFLGRDEEFSAFSNWLNEEFEGELLGAMQ